MKRPRRIIAYSELVFDHMFVDGGDGLQYLDGRGGGSIWNVLVGAAAAGAETLGAGVGGEDSFGESARIELTELGVNTEQIHLVAGKRTRLIFEKLEPARLDGEVPKHTLSAKCPVCAKTIPDCDIARADKYDRPVLSIEAGDAFCVDRLTRDRLALVRAARKVHALCVADVGRIGYLRYLPSTAIVEMLAEFDLLTMPADVARSVFGRSGLISPAEMVALPENQTLLITDGQRGVQIIHKRRGRVVVHQREGVSARHYVDSAGAGDAFLASILNSYVATPLMSPGNRRVLDGQILQWVDLALGHVMPVLTSLGPRGHIRQPNLRGIVPASHRMKGCTLEQLRKIAFDRSICPVCETRLGVKTIKATSKVLARTPSFKRNTAELLRRAFGAFDRRESIQKCQRLLKDAKTAYVIGTGGSYPAAKFVSLLITHECGGPAVAFRPFDYVRTGGSSDLAVIITYSGATPDCQLAIARAKALKTKTIVLVTGRPDPPLAEHLRAGDAVVYHSKNGRERGFVSVAGTVAPCVLWAAAVMDNVEMARFVRGVSDRSQLVPKDVATVVDSLRAGEVIDVFGGGWAWPALLDFESKMTEGGLGTIQLHEEKDFSHGRFILVMNERRRKTAKVMFNIGCERDYTLRLRNSLERSSDVTLLKSDQEGMLGALDLLIQTQFFVRAIADRLGKNISKPAHIPKDGIALYRWRDRKSAPLPELPTLFDLRHPVHAARSSNGANRQKKRR